MHERGAFAYPEPIRPNRFQERRVDGIAPRGVVVDLTEKRAEKIAASEYFFTAEWMQQEVARVKKEPVKSGEKPWYEMKGTGFWVGAQTRQLLRNLPSAPELFPDALELELSKVATDIRHFESEYLKQQASLKWDLGWEMRGGEKRIVAPEYVGADKKAKLWSEVTSKDERDGVVYDTLFGNKKKGIIGVEEKLREAKPGTTAVIVSPKGWSGYEGITYPESQVYVIQKQADDSLKAYTFRYDGTIEQNEKLQKSLGQEIPQPWNSKERIKNTVANVTYLSEDEASTQPQSSFARVVEAMQESVGGREVAYKEGGDMRTFDDIKAFLEDEARYTSMHPLTEKLIDRFKAYVRDRVRKVSSLSSLEQDIQIAMALTPLHLNRLYRNNEQRKQQEQENANSFGSDTTVHQNDVLSLAGFGVNYQEEVADLKERPGCAGGGESTSVDSMGRRRKSQQNGASESEPFSCPQCHFTTSSPVGNTCPGCGLTKEQFAKDAGILCD